MRMLINWIYQVHGVIPINVVYETPKESGVSIPRLTIIFDTPKEEKVLLNKNGFEMNKTKKRTILRKFISLVREMELEETYNLSGLFVVCDNFSRSFSSECMKKVWKESNELFANNFPNLLVWRTIIYDEHLIVFLWNKSGLRKAKKNGTIQATKELLYNTYIAYDEFNYMTLEKFPLHFDTKQNLDKKYSGSFRAYFD